MSRGVEREAPGGAPAALPPARGMTAAAVALVLVGGAAAYSNTFDVPFIFDDRNSIVENPTIRRLWPPGPVLSPPPEAVTVIGRPAVNLSLALNYAFCGLDVRAYHAVNLAVHLAAALALFGVVRRTLALPAMAARFGPAATGLAAAVALIWTLHPIQTESVTYVVQRAEALGGLFYLVTLYSAVRGATSARPAPWYAAAASACALGMASKEIVASAPLIVLLYDRAFLAGSLREALRRRWPLYAALAATWGILAALLLASGQRGGTAGFGLNMSPWEYLAAQPAFIVHYLRLCFWPDPLVLDYGWTAGARPGDAPAYGAAALLLAATGVALRRWPGLGLLGAWFLAILAPSSSIVPLVGQVAAEHRMYLPLAAVVALAVVGGYALGARFLARPVAGGARRRLIGRVLAGAAVFALAAALGAATFRRNQDYRTAVTIWEDTVRKRPENPRAQSNLGAVMVREGRDSEALEKFNEALRLAPDYADAWYNRGLARAQRGDLEGAVGDFSQAIALRPAFAAAYSGRAGAWQRLGRLDLALEGYTRALDLAPHDAAAWSNRGEVYRRLRRHDLAASDAARATLLGPDLAEAWFNRGLVRQEEGALDDAAGDYTRALELAPDYADAYTNRAAVRLLARRPDLALADYSKAIDLRPADPAAWSNRGNTYRLMSNFSEAIRDCTHALQLAPDYAPALLNRAIAYYESGAYDKARSDVEACRRLGRQVDENFLKALREAPGAAP